MYINYMGRTEAVSPNPLPSSVYNNSALDIVSLVVVIVVKISRFFLLFIIMH